MPSSTALAPSIEEEVPPHVADFYRRSLRVLRDAGIPFLVGGAFSLACYTGIRRATKDLDLFILREDFERIAQRMRQRGWRTELTYPHWLAKVYDGDAFIDLIFNSGNGVTPVDARWFHGNCRAEILGVPVLVANVEDCLLSKAFIMERERYDGGDIAHLLLARAERLDWASLLERFGAHWRVLLSHLTLFGYIYPGERHRIPDWVMARLLDRLGDEMHGPPAPAQRRVCAGTLLSRGQYLHDVEQAGYVDGRLTPASGMTANDVAVWTRDIEPAPAPPPRGTTDDRE
ncbi:putative nucleotidyltransferase [Variovorax boronicumulans]|uniref:Nucleotidyltransferase n=1 Tax=Variovorax boronicumulans TaxID=436515 RepID=A0AAW8DT09_9BURK|nr:nucleotidyltransferase [Variovorax boronicumulans]MDP9877322.1 putative nucleotidyltransferase [Variovorax boronicumulans]MDP9922608.1 putative nucleotidyltransferase [Variovorax boronicumulans]